LQIHLKEVLSQGEEWTIQELQEGKSYSRTAIRRTLMQFVSAGYLEVIAEGGGRGLRTVYKLKEGKEFPGY
jgi:DNA-binding GntR family transcriptional regulator